MVLLTAARVTALHLSHGPVIRKIGIALIGCEVNALLGLG
jgi:hypothetical protein